MALYLISYVLKNPGQDYRAVEKAIREIDENAERVMRSHFVVETDEDEEIDVDTIRAHVWDVMDSNDQLLVVGLDLVAIKGQNLCPNTYLEFLQRVPTVD